MKNSECGASGSIVAGDASARKYGNHQVTDQHRGED
jgi:hypothetical protein